MVRSGEVRFFFDRQSAKKSGAAGNFRAPKIMSKYYILDIPGIGNANSANVLAWTGTTHLETARNEKIYDQSTLEARSYMELPKTSSPGLRRNGASQFKGHVAKLLFLFEFAKRWGFNTKKHIKKRKGICQGRNLPTKSQPQSPKVFGFSSL